MLLVLAIPLFGCPAPTWLLDAELPGARTPTAGTALRFRVTSSGSSVANISPASVSKDENGDWQARHRSALEEVGEVLVFEDEQLTRVSMVGPCQGGCEASCDPPEGEFIHVEEPEVVPVWTLTDTREISVPKGDSCGMDLKVSVERRGGSLLRYVVVPSNPADADKVSIEWRGDDVLKVYWGCSDIASASFTIKAVLSDSCAEEPCAASSDASLRIVDLSTVL